MNTFASFYFEGKVISKDKVKNYFFVSKRNSSNVMNYVALNYINKSGVQKIVRLLLTGIEIQRNLVLPF